MKREQLIHNALFWLRNAELGQADMITHLGFKIEDEAELFNFMPIGPTLYPTFVFRLNQAGGYVQHDKFVIRSLFGLLEMRDFAPVPNVYSVTLTQYANQSVIDAYENYMDGCPLHTRGVMCSCGWHKQAVAQVSPPKGWMHYDIH